MDLGTVLLFFVGVPVVGVLMIVIAIIGVALAQETQPRQRVWARFSSTR